MYLIDFKEGVEFQWYATYRLPHARVVAIQSEREFGLSVLQRLDGILRERGDKFRDAGVNDLAGYRAAKPNERMPRILLVIDEFQEVVELDPHLPKLMRAVFQQQPEVAHVYLGSRRHMMERIFNDENEPFWRSAKQMELSVIEPPLFAGYLEARFRESGKTIEPSAAERATCSVPISPPAPALLSSTTGWPSTSLSAWPIARL